MKYYLVLYPDVYDTLQKILILIQLIKCLSTTDYHHSHFINILSSNDDDITEHKKKHTTFHCT